jgi:AcrR family transcriptional regulator
VSTETRADLTRQRILDAAAKVFREQGYAHTRLSDIAEAVGMKTGSLYYHFPSREGLVTEILHLGIAKAWEHVSNTIDSLTPESNAYVRLEAAIRAHIEAVLHIGDYSAAQARIVGQIPSDLRRIHLEEQRAYGTYLNGFFQAAKTAGYLRPETDLLIARTIMVGAVTRIAEWLPRRDLSGDVVDQVVRTLLQGMATSDAESGTGARRKGRPRVAASSLSNTA